MDELSRIRCERFNCTLSARACARRHLDTWASGGRRGSRRIVRCAACPIGAAVAADLMAGGWTPPPPSDAPVVLPAVQRAARDRALLERLNERRDEPLASDMNPLAEAALCTPDDRGRSWTP